MAGDGAGVAPPPPAALDGRTCQDAPREFEMRDRRVSYASCASETTVIDADTGLPVEQVTQNLMDQMDSMSYVVDDFRACTSRLSAMSQSTPSRQLERAATAATRLSVASAELRTPSAAGREASGAEGAPAEQDQYKGLGFWVYLICCLIITASFSLTATWLWSDMGKGDLTLSFLDEYTKYKWVFNGTMAAVPPGAGERNEAA
ncbi:unnamed protein product [Prorocentrum cordatum]|uniref:Uncharacterized protein n=1 Tax=Prorocentrum cordatum TaxID=2364126 RepID=A0ABN9Y396_9DINO|nr:unnamed protein product [Polarella glacialis]